MSRRTHSGLAWLVGKALVAVASVAMPCLGQSEAALTNSRSVFPPPDLDFGYVYPPIRPFGRSGLIVRDGLDDQLYVMTASGARVRPIGRIGEGPGEYRSILGLWIRGDSLVLTDGILRRTSVFNVPSGKLIDTWPVAQSVSWHSSLVRPLVSFDKDCWLGSVTRATPRTSGTARIETVEILLLVKESGEKFAFDSVFTRENAGLKIQPLGEMAANRIPSATATAPLLALAPDGLGFAIFEAQTQARDGIVIYRTRHPCTEPVRRQFVAARARELPRDEVAAIYRKQLGPRQRTGASLEDAVADAVRHTPLVGGKYFAPLFSAAFIDAAGRAWIEVEGGIGLTGDDATRRWLRVSSDGSPTNTLIAPGDVKLQSAKGSRVLGWLPSDEGGSVVEFDIRSPK